MKRILLIVLVVMLSVFAMVLVSCTEPHVHTIVEKPGYPATCTKEGLTDAQYCSDCGEFIVQHETIDRVPCQESAKISVKDPTVTMDGKYITVCDVCGKELSRGVLYATGSEGLTYVLNKDEKSYTVKVGSCEDAEIFVPKYHEEKPVTVIGSFEKCETLVSIVLPETITAIGDKAFAECSALASIVLPEGVESIGKSAFAGCTSLESLNIPQATKKIGDQAFANCTSLSSITIPDAVTSIGKEAFAGCVLFTTITIPQAVATLGDGAFKDCVALVNVNFEDDIKITAISSHLFSGCSLLDSIIIPKNVASAGEGAFEGCVSLSSVNFGDDSALTTLPVSAFEGCVSLKSVDFGANSRLSSIPNSAFKGCSSLLNIIVPDTATSIGESAFEGCSALDNVVIGLKVRTIGEGAFLGCDLLTNVVFRGDVPSYPYSEIINLTDVHIENGLTVLDEYEFVDCAKLVNISIPNSIILVGMDAFSGCNSLAYNVYNGDKYLGNAENPYLVLMMADSDISSFEALEGTKVVYCTAFMGCDSLKSVVLPKTVTNIAYGAFWGCSALESITLPFVGTKFDAATLVNGTTSVLSVFGSIFGFVEYDNSYAVGQHYYFDPYEGKYGEYKFFMNYIPKSLTSVTIEGGIIPTNAFRNCNSIKNIVIGEDVTNIYNEAFFHCVGIESVEFVGDSKLAYIGKHSFDTCTSIESIEIPASVVLLGEYALANCDALTSVEFGLGSQLNTISSFAFYDCDLLEDIEIPANVEHIGQSSFYNCKALAEINIPASVNFIGYQAFYGCSSLESVEFEETSNWWRTSDMNATYGTKFAIADLANSSTAARYLLHIYNNYFWKR